MSLTSADTDLNSLIEAHNVATDAHADIRGSIPRLHFRGEWDADTAYIFGDIVFAGNADNHAFFIASVASTNINPMTQNQTAWKPVSPEGEGRELAAPWVADGLYQLGDVGSLVTYNGKLYFYTSRVARNTSHRPDLYPAYWQDISDTVGLINLAEDGSARVSRGTLVLMAEDDALFLTATDAGSSSLRTAATIRANATPGGDFVHLNAPPPPAYRHFVSGLEVRWNEGMLTRFGTGWYVVKTPHDQTTSQTTPSSSNFDQLLSFRRLSHSTYTSLAVKDSSVLYLTGDSGVVRLYLGTTKVVGP